MILFCSLLLIVFLAVALSNDGELKHSFKSIDLNSIIVLLDAEM